MKNTYTFLLLCIILLLGSNGCQQAQQTDYNKNKPRSNQSSDRNNTGENDTQHTSETTKYQRNLRERTYDITENFEQPDAMKTSYLDGTVKFSSGPWYLDDAMIGTSKADGKNGGKSLRTRDLGKISMLFDIRGTKGVRISHASYGNDKPASWQLWVSFDQGRSYSQVDQTITTSTNKLQTATFKIAVSKSLRFEIRKVSGGKNRINIDDFILDTGREPGVPTGSISDNTIGDTAAHDTLIPPAKADSINGESASNDQLLLGNPSNARHEIQSSENYLIDQKYYVSSYSRSRAIPNWVSWHIGSSDLGKAKRTNDFRSNSGLPSAWYSADDSAYKGSGFDKGHNCPSGDRSSSPAANSSTFLMDNIIPQAPNNNQRTWEHLESYCRDQVKKGNEVYVIMGSYGKGGTGKNGYFQTIANGKITVPSNIWKVVIVIPEGDNDLQRINSKTTVIAVDTPNDNNISANWSNYLCTVRDIEHATGYNLLSALPKVIQDIIETEKFKGGN